MGKLSAQGSKLQRVLGSIDVKALVEKSSVNPNATGLIKIGHHEGVKQY